MLIETFTVGMLSTNCYVVNNPQTKEEIIIDPGLDFPIEAQQVFEYITKEKLKVKQAEAKYHYDVDKHNKFARFVILKGIIYDSNNNWQPVK